MEILRILRDHLPSMSDHQSFSVILNRVEGQINSTEMNDDQIVVDCIELEGFDGCGKTTLANELQVQLRTFGYSPELLSTPPVELMPYRQYFDQQIESIRRAYYNLGNLIVSLKMKNESNSGTIFILDRYWPSTIAYQFARQNEDQPIEISWPKYLVQPALIVYIYVDEIERRRRIAQRTIAVTDEEKQLEGEERFRRRLDSIYRHHIPTERLHLIDGNRATDMIVKDILNEFQKNRTINPNEG